MRVSERRLVQYPVLMLIYSETLARCLFQFDSKQSKEGNFSSPNYPENYRENVECFYNFLGHDFETLKLTFYFFDLEPPYFKGCLTDYVDISTITASNVKELVGRYCGNKIDTPLLSMHPKAEIIFRTNHIVHHKGFFGAYEFKDESKCEQHVCRDSHYCLNSASTICHDMPQYCIDKSLICDGLPNCSEDDYSDEEKCHLPLLAGCGGALILCMLGACTVYYVYRGKKRRLEREALAMQLRQLEHSPVSIARGPTYYANSDCSIHGHLANLSDDSFESNYKGYPTVV